MGVVRLTETRAFRVLEKFPVPGHGNMTLADHINDYFYALVRLATDDVEHCGAGPACYGVVWSVCACSCITCSPRRRLLTEAQLTWGLPHAVRMRSETRDAWALRLEETGSTEPPPARGCKAPGISARLVEHWHTRIMEAQSRGLTVRHCYATGCMDDSEGFAMCACECDGCARVIDLLRTAMCDGSEVRPS